MIPVFQDRFVKTHRTGNCFNACVASIMEIPLSECSDILPGQGGKLWWRRWQTWFKDRGALLDIAPVTHPPEGYTIASVYTERCYPQYHEKAGKRISHAVVCLDGKIVHDPYPNPTGSVFISYYYLILADRGQDDDF